MTYIKQDFICPNCKKKNRIKVYNEIDEEKVIDVINRDIFKFTCKSCNESVVLEYKVKIIGKNYVIYYTPSENEEIVDNENKTLRVCDNFDDLKEKLMIFQDDLNDIIIEFIKKFLLNQLDEQIRDSVSNIRYDGKNEENLIFYLIGYNKSIASPISFYQSLSKRAKIKKTKNAIMIDNNTYDKYFKLR